MTVGILVLADQLSQENAVLADLEQQCGAREARHHCRVLLIESSGSLRRMPLHRQRLVLLWSALRHFCAELREAGWQVDHREAESFGEALRTWCGQHGITELHAMEPADRPVRQALERIISRWEHSGSDSGGSGLTGKDQSSDSASSPSPAIPRESGHNGFPHNAINHNAIKRSAPEHNERNGSEANHSQSGAANPRADQVRPDLSSSNPINLESNRAARKSLDQDNRSQNNPGQGNYRRNDFNQKSLNQVCFSQGAPIQSASGLSSTNLPDSAGCQECQPRVLPTRAPSLVWHASNAFLWSREGFAAWASGRRQLRMELFYREGRRRFAVLMEGEGPGAKPRGGQWNFDHDNRRPPVKGLQGPEPLWFQPDAITREVIAKVRRLAASQIAEGRAPLPGDLEPFGWAVTRQQALAVLEHFIATRLAHFGPYQDAMVGGQPTLWHSLISPYLNLGLLHPREVIQRLEEAGGPSAGAPPPPPPLGQPLLSPGADERSAEPAGSQTAAAPAAPVPLASLEGVIRQILGWREYTHGLYHWLGPDYPGLNHFQATRELPAWLEHLGSSGMACMDTVLAELRTTGYAHHIQRLMVLANYGLLAGLEPQALTAWFHRQFIDGHDWVMQTNVIGMGLFADGGLLASKPYAASGNYINRMSTYCKGCRFKVKQRSGPEACPFNSLYWDFLARHSDQLRANPRMALVIKQLDRLGEGELAAIRATAAAHLEAQPPGPAVRPA